MYLRCLLSCLNGSSKDSTALTESPVFEKAFKKLEHALVLKYVNQELFCFTNVSARGQGAFKLVLKSIKEEEGGGREERRRKEKEEERKKKSEKET